MSEWQPIETAPRDGAFILVWGPGYTSPVIRMWHDASWDDGDFFSGIPADEYTHWQPLPDPPYTPGVVR